MGPDGNLLSKKPDGPGAIDDPSPNRPFTLVTDDDDV